MNTPSITTNLADINPAPAAGAQPAAAPAPVAQAQPAPAAQPVVQAPGLPATAPEPRSVERTPTRKLIADADEDVPADADLIEMSPMLLKKRLERATRKQLRDRFGTDDPEAIKADLEELKQFRADRETQRLATMTETDRLREQYSQMEQRAIAAEARAEQIQNERVVAEQDQQINSIMAKHINPRYLKHEARNLAEYISTLSDADLADPEAVVEAWCRQQISEDGALAIPQAAPPPLEVQAPPTRPAGFPPVHHTNGANVQRPTNATQNGPQVASTFAPGRANSASDAEWRRLKQQNGWSF